MKGMFIKRKFSVKQKSTAEVCKHERLYWGQLLEGAEYCGKEIDKQHTNQHPYIGKFLHRK